MQKLTIEVEVDVDMADEVVRQCLKMQLNYLKKDLDSVKSRNKGIVFSTNPDEDIKEIDRHIDSFETVLRYYGEEL